MDAIGTTSICSPTLAQFSGIKLKSMQPIEMPCDSSSSSRRKSAHHCVAHQTVESGWAPTPIKWHCLVSGRRCGWRKFQNTFLVSEHCDAPMPGIFPREINATVSELHATDVARPLSGVVGSRIHGFHRRARVGGEEVEPEALPDKLNVGMRK